MLRLLKNKIYLVTSFGICCEISIVSGFVVFLPKYIETQFGTSKSEASLFTGKIILHFVRFTKFVALIFRDFLKSTRQNVTKYTLFKWI